MRNHSKYSFTAFIIIILIVLIICSKTAVLGAEDGVNLCIQTIIPSIFPFLFLTMLACNHSESFSLPLLNPICKITGIPTSTQHILILALIGGYPIGAQVVAKAYKGGQITKESAKRLLGFCNNAGPSFIFGLLSTIFNNPLATVSLWLIHICSAIFVGIILPKRTVRATTVSAHVYPDKLTNILHTSIRVMAVICGWVILFRILLTLFDCLFVKLPSIMRIVVCGLLELSNGCIMIGSIESEYVRFIAASALLAAGGLCVLLQTLSVVEGVGLGLYVPGKLLQMLFSISLSCVIGSLIYNEPLRIPAFVTTLTLSLGLALIFRKKSSSIICVNTV